MHRLVPYLLFVLLPMSAWAQEASDVKGSTLKTPFGGRVFRDEKACRIGVPAVGECELLVQVEEEERLIAAA